MKIEIVSKEHIRPSYPTPDPLREFKLSFIDERIPHTYMPLILCYSFSEDNDIKRRRLKTSLSDALVEFYPLAGRTKGQILIDCNDEGILYIEANADVKLLDFTDAADPGDVDKLSPFVTNGCVSTAEEQLAVQLTTFKCGGMAIGICLSHRIADVCSLSSFIKCWFAAAMATAELVSPVFNSSSLFPPRSTPDFKPNLTSISVQPPTRVNLVTKRFIFTSSAIDELKSQATTTNSPTRVEVLTAFLWNRCLLSKGRLSGKSVAFHPVNLRRKIPELTDNSFGNIFQMVCAESESTDDEWIQLVENVRAAFSKLDAEYINKLLGENGFELAKENFMQISKYLALGNVEVFKFTSYCRFASLYEADFGWGKPVWVSTASYRNKDTIFLFDSVKWPGGIEAWIVMTDDDMERLQHDSTLQRFTSLDHLPNDSS